MNPRGLKVELEIPGLRLWHQWGMVPFSELYWH